ncbi:MAG: hypothetical protein GY717_18570 [Rhodobacteraceae bacterium]|nr:hypothetical protein [Paracoccaceae bacterium]
MVLSKLASYCDKFSAKTLDGKSILKAHEERNSLTYKLHIWTLRLSDSSSLSDQQKIERVGWTQGALGALIGIGVILLSACL